MRRKRLSQLKKNEVFALEIGFYDTRYLKFIEKNNSGFISETCDSHQKVRFCNDARVFVHK